MAKKNTLRLKFDSARKLSPAPESKSAAKINERYDLFINGTFVKPKSGKYFGTINPANEEKLSMIAEANAADVDMAVKAGIPVNELQFHTGDLVVNLLDHEREKQVKVTDPVEVFGAGTGFMLIKREVMERLKDKVDTYLDDDETTLHEYFFLKKDPVLNKQLTEDYSFCALAREHGMKVFVAPWARLSHTGTYTFTGSVIPVKGENNGVG